MSPTRRAHGRKTRRAVPAYGDLGCLATPRACLDGYAGPAFLVAPLASERSGYRRVFRGGRAASRPRTFESFAYTATPVTVG